MSFNKNQFRNLIERVLDEKKMRSDAAVNLLLGTAAQESGFGTFLRQINGPARGVFQCESATFGDLLLRYWNKFSFPIGDWKFEELEWDLRKAIIMARLKYYSCPGPIPDTLQGQAEYYKKWYNTPLGAATIQEYLDNWKKYVS